MDAEQLTYEELAALMAQKAPQEHSDTITVHGMEFKVYPERLRSWRVFKLIGAIDDENTSEFTRVAKAFELLEAVTDAKADDIVDSLGGDDADVMDVLGFVMDVITAVAPKNS